MPLNSTSVFVGKQEILFNGVQRPQKVFGAPGNHTQGSIWLVSCKGGVVYGSPVPWGGTGARSVTGLQRVRGIITSPISFPICSESPQTCANSKAGAHPRRQWDGEPCKIE